MSMLKWPALFAAMVIVLIVVFLAIVRDLPDQANAVLLAVSLTTLTFSFVLTRSNDLRFWLIRIRARLGRGVAPAWKLRASYRVRRSRAEISDVAARLRDRYPDARVAPIGDRRLEVDAGSRMVVEWLDAIEDHDRGLVDWHVVASFDHASVQYHDSVRFLSRVMLPVLEAVEDALEVVERRYHLIVEYGPGGNPFEGFLVRTAPEQSVASYQIQLRQSSVETVTMMKDRLDLESISPSRLQEIVERLLAFSGSLEQHSLTPPR